MDQYLNVLDICLNGREGYRVFDKMDRTGTGTRGFFGHQMRFDLQKGFPLLTTKKVGFRQIAAELIWFLRGETNAKELNKLGAKIWDEWAVTWKTLLDDVLDRTALRGSLEVLKLLMSEDIIKVIKLGEKNVEIPENWRSRRAVIDGAEAIEYRHPHYEQVALERLCKHGFITPEEYEEMEQKVGELGPIYGKQWRAWPDMMAVEIDDHRAQVNAVIDDYHVIGSDDKHFYFRREIDQIGQLLRDLKEKPFSRRLIISGWNCAALPDEKERPDVNALRGKQALPPCHTLFQFLVEPKTLDEMVNEPAALHNQHVQEMYENYEHYRLAMGEDNPQVIQTEELLRVTLKHLEIKDRLLHCHIYIRSNDVFLGMPFNIASYALMTMVFAKISGYDAGELVYSTGDTHLYSNHFEQAEKQLQREPRELPLVLLDPKLESLEDLTMDSFKLVNYTPHERIKAPIAV